MHLEVVLDTDDLAHIKSLLEAQDRAAPPPDPSVQFVESVQRLLRLPHQQREARLEALVERLAALEAVAGDKIPAFDRWQARQDEQLAEFTDRLSSLERLAQGIIDNP